MEKKMEKETHHEQGRWWWKLGCLTSGAMGSVHRIDTHIWNNIEISCKTYDVPELGQYQPDAGGHCSPKQI